MPDSSSSTPYEEKEIRCPKLGHQVSFEYCRVEQRDRPCSRSLVCWSVHFDVEALFREILTPEEFERCFSQPPPSKIVTLVELIERAKKIAQQKKEED